MSKFLDLGLGIAIINVYYSLAYFLMWCVALQKSYDNDTEPFVWLAVYMGNVFLNAILFLGLRKRDRCVVVVWFSLTLLWFAPKLYDHKRGCRLDERGSTYQLINLIMEGYVILSFAIMILVYNYLPHELPPVVPRHAKGPHDIQMEDLSSTMATTNKEKAEVEAEGEAEAEAEAEDEETKLCLPSGSNDSKDATGCRDQQVSSFEFHRAAAELDDGSDD